MSITFEPQPGEPTGYQIVIWSDEAMDFVAESDHVFTDWQDAELAYVAGGFDPMDASIVVLHDGSDDPTLNVANGNAVALLQELGVGEFAETGFGAIPEFGTIDPQDLLDRLVLVGAVDHPATDTVEYRGEGGCTVVDFGRSAGQMNRYVDELRKVAEAAKARGVMVQWA